MRMPGLPLQIVVAAAAGIALGLLLPEPDTGWDDARAAVLKTGETLGKVFIKLIKMVVAPLLLCVITAGIAGMEDTKKVGRVGGKAILYFEVITTVALLLGLAAVNVFRPGDGLDLGRFGGFDPAKYREAAAKHTLLDFLAGIVPDNIFAALAKGDLLQVLFFSILLGLVLSGMGRHGRSAVIVFQRGAEILLKMIGLIMLAAPVGVFGAMLYTVGQFGAGSLLTLGKFMAVVYGTMLVFVFGVLGAVCWWWCGVSLLRLLAHIREEIILVLGMSSSEAALPRLMEKMVAFGCPQPIVGLVTPTGYSFNLDGTSIYLTIAAVFIAQAYGIELTWSQQFTILLVLMVTSKGSAAVTGGGFVTLTATLEATELVPLGGLALLVGVDRFLSEARATVNLIGNAVACVVVSQWEGEFRPGGGEAAEPPKAEG